MSLRPSARSTVRTIVASSGSACCSRAVCTRCRLAATVPKSALIRLRRSSGLGLGLGVGLGSGSSLGSGADARLKLLDEWAVRGGVADRDQVAEATLEELRQH